MSWDWPPRWNPERPFDWAHEEMENLGWPTQRSWQGIKVVADDRVPPGKVLSLPPTWMESEWPEQIDEDLAWEQLEYADGFPDEEGGE